MLEYIEDARRALNAKAYYSALCFLSRCQTSALKSNIQTKKQ